MLSEDIAGTDLGSCRVCIKYIMNIENFVITKVKKPKFLSTVSRLVYILLYLLCLIYFFYIIFPADLHKPWWDPIHMINCCGKEDNRS